MNHYIVASPECSDGGYGMEPPEYFHCVIAVEAKNPGKAKALALMDKEFLPWIKEVLGDNPFTGLKVSSGKCPHGICQCELCAEDEPTCPECLEQFNTELKDAQDK